MSPQGIMSSEKASNSPGLCPVKGQNLSLGTQTGSRNYFSSLSLCVTKTSNWLRNYIWLLWSMVCTEHLAVKTSYKMAALLVHSLSYCPEILNLWGISRNILKMRIFGTCLSVSYTTCTVRFLCIFATDLQCIIIYILFLVRYHTSVSTAIVMLRSSTLSFTSTCTTQETWPQL
jgi:hypothetical protein